MADCEWMFGDAASGALGFSEMAHLNPLRWSGSVSFEKAISDLEAVLSTGSRPIMVKVPAGVSTASQSFATTEKALEFLKKKDPAELLRRQNQYEQAMEAVKVATEAKDAAESEAKPIRENVVSQEELFAKTKAEAEDAGNAAKQATLTVESVQSKGKCEWMFGDAGKGLLGFKVARLNPLRWSGAITFKQGIQQLQEALQQKESASRTVVVRVPPGNSGDEKTFNSFNEAISYLEGLCPVLNKAREESDAANAAHKAAEAKVSDIETALAETKKKLEAAMVTVSESEEGLDNANKHAAIVKAELEELSTP